jgi:NTP pyrophosphatase (non-canonical NTP hydrolase)
MTFTVTPENLYFSISLVTLILQAWQVRKVEKLKKEVDDLWEQIKIIAISTGGVLEKLEKKIDAKQDKQ